MNSNHHASGDQGESLREEVRRVAADPTDREEMRIIRSQLAELQLPTAAEALPRGQQPAPRRRR